MNSCAFIVKIISHPEQHINADNISIVKTKVQFGKLRKRKSFDQFQIYIWGNLGKEFIKYYGIGDYILIQGILTFKPSNNGSRFQKETNMTVIKVFPFLLSELPE